MDHGVIRILNSKQNKSQFVNLAVMKLHSKEMHFDIGNVPTKQLYASLMGRLPDTDPLRMILEERYNKES